jgi:hypothetical protein
MKILLLAVVVSLCALALYPVVLSVGQRVAHKLKEVQAEIDESQEKPEDTTGEDEDEAR